MTVTKFAYLKPCENDSPFYVHVMLNETDQIIRLYYYMGWCKQEQVPEKILHQWQDDIHRVSPLLTQKKNNIKIRAKSVRVRGRCKIRCQLFKDLIGFTEKDMTPEIPTQIECYVNTQKKVVEITMTLPYKYLGAFPQECHKLHIFTTNPDFESIRSRLVFFDMKHIMGFVARKDNITSDHISSVKSDKKLLSSQPKHDFNSVLSGGEVGVHSESASCQETKDRIDHDDMRLDPMYCTGRHPFGCSMVDDPTSTNTTNVIIQPPPPVIPSGHPDSGGITESIESIESRNVNLTPQSIDNDTTRQRVDLPTTATPIAQDHRVDEHDEMRAREVPTSATDHHDQIDQHSTECRSDTRPTEHDRESIINGNQDTEKSNE